MRPEVAPRGAVPVLAAAVGVVVAHAAGYVAAFPSAAERGPHLDATGHGYWPMAVASAVVAAGVAVVLAATAGAGAGAGAGGRAVPPGRGWRALAGWQLAAFAVMEIGERAVAGGGAAGLVGSPEVWLGLVLQLPVALLASRLLHTAERGAGRVAAALRRRGARSIDSPAVHGPSPVVRLVSAAPSPAGRPRAPPLLLV